MSDHAPVILDIAGKRLTADDRRRIAHPLTGGLILFTRNWTDRAQLTGLIAEMKDIRPDLLVAIDHEGGRVQRLRSDGFTALPAMAELGERWMESDGPADLTGTSALDACAAATAAGYVLASELRACGIDLSFTPVLDLDHGRSAVIGNRAFHRDPRVVTQLARCLMHGLLQAGMANCGKHFPGHGYAAADSHTDTPVDERTLEVILADDILPYDWLANVLTAVMPAHVIYPAVDARPAGFSPRWLQQVLRQQMGFNGAVFSDDLSMEGARRVADVKGGTVLDYDEAAVLALNAGCDLVLLCNQSTGKGKAVDDLLDGLDKAAASGDWTPDGLSEARRLELLPMTPPFPWDDLMHHAPYQHALELLS
jgi:beta-N-acetylhexosaminidase